MYYFLSYWSSSWHHFKRNGNVISFFFVMKFDLDIEAMCCLILLKLIYVMLQTNFKIYLIIEFYCIYSAAKIKKKVLINTSNVRHNIWLYKFIYKLEFMRFLFHFCSQIRKALSSVYSKNTNLLLLQDNARVCQFCYWQGYIKANYFIICNTEKCHSTNVSGNAQVHVSVCPSV